jgi:hypothetical protein
MLDHTKFQVTIEQRDIQSLPSVLKLFQELHMYDTSYVYIKGNESDVVCIATCHKDAKIDNTAPLEAMIPLIQHKLSLLPAIQDPFRSFDGSSIPAYEVFLDHTGLKIKRTYLYAGK